MAAEDGNTDRTVILTPDHERQLPYLRATISATEAARSRSALQCMATLHDLVEASADDTMLGSVVRVQVEKMKPLDDAYAAAEDAVDALWNQRA